MIAADLPDEGVLDELLEARWKTEQHVCQLRTMSEIIHESGVERIDLLKVDVEKSEMDVLAGINEDDWQKIQQVVLEVHDIDDRVEKISQLLRHHGFDVTVLEEAWFKGTDIYNIFAVRPANDSEARTETSSHSDREATPVWCSPGDLTAELRSYLKEKLPEFMVPSAIVFLDALPLTPNGKLDRRALPEPDQNKQETGKPFVPPRTPAEEMLAAIWSELLGVERVSIHDSFFELGGHSLLLTQLASRIRKAFDVEVPLRVLFDVPTIVEMTTAIAATQAEQLDAEEMSQMLEELNNLSQDELDALLKAEEI
jgi:acyl carrier protein